MRVSFPAGRLALGGWADSIYDLHFLQMLLNAQSASLSCALPALGRACILFSLAVISAAVAVVLTGTRHGILLDDSVVICGLRTASSHSGPNVITLLR